MNISAPRVDVSSPSDASQGQYAGQSEHIAKKGLARGFRRSIAAAFTIPPLVAVASVLPLEVEGAVVVTAWSALMLTYILTTLAKARTDLHTAARQWTEMRVHRDEMADDYYALACAHERLKNKYIRQRGHLSLVTKQAGVATVAGLTSERESATVVQFPVDGGV